MRKIDWTYGLLAISCIINLILLWSHFKLMSLATAQEPVCALEELVWERAGEIYCKDFQILKKEDGTIIVKKIQ